ncbi:energy-coupling factor transporter ATPase [Sporolactobacillus sp. CPB3-1]|uniref:Energy-coupling factor transporter ATPase n=2 Tax=Sporolactobacillus mangiferae TaxID=2940498 RepID=A0ABT0MBU3_9BACL|nr:ABC transporter ATP-binding protein [Sporolactobacillus mangiferae]MCL1632336.1 energy-coupling factor transporter ATPase [Sporolactobacillus mangiferae]
MNELIRTEQVTFHYPGEDAAVLKKINFTIEKGEFLAVIGSNGSGKSTLCKLFNGLIPHFYSGDFEGTVTVCGQDTRTSSVAKLSCHVGYVFQDFENQLVQARVLDDVSFAPLNYGKADYLQRGRRALKIVGLDHLEDEFVWQLSGGQKHLLALAGCLAMDPDIIVIDEPTAQLDPYHAKEIYDVLKTLNEQFGKTIITIEHHTEFIAEYCKNVLLLNQGAIIWKKTVREALAEVDLLTELNIYPPQVAQAACRLSAGEPVPVTLDEGIRFFGEKAMQHADDVRSEHKPSAEEPIVTFEDINFSYKRMDRTRVQILKNINLMLYKSEQVAVVGNNGAGKSTLMRLITGVKKPDSGILRIGSLSVTATHPERIADQVAYIYQNPEEMFIDDSVRKDIAFYPRERKIAGYEAKIDEILDQFHLVDLQDKDSRLMSGGQQRRASLAIGAAMEPSVILLDEPTANLDMATRKHLTQFIVKLKERIDLVMIATHDMQLVSEWATRVIVLHHGQIIFDGRKEELFANPALMDKAGLFPPQIVKLSLALGVKPVAYSVDSFVRRFRKEGSKWQPSKISQTK